MIANRVVAVVAALLAGGCATVGGPGAVPAAPVPDTALSLVKGSVFDAPASPVVKEDASDPGERPVLPRAYPGAPPLVPHGVAAFLPITVEKNSCVDCHSAKAKAPGEPTPMPPSHYTDLRNAPGTVGGKVTGGRWDCVVCHVAQTDAKPLVGNRFVKQP